MFCIYCSLRIHYVHTIATYETRNKTIIPVLLLHGWPGSMREFFDFTHLLASPDNEDFDIVFEVVAPSLPGYGYSDQPARPGFGVSEMAIVLRNLMQRLNYDRFYIQGGDWGSALGSAIATIFPENVIGYHSNGCFAASPLFFVKQYIASWSPRHFIPKPEYEVFHFPGLDKLTTIIEETGYLHIQATKPDTIGMNYKQENSFQPNQCFTHRYRSGPKSHRIGRLYLREILNLDQSGQPTIARRWLVNLRR